MLDVVVDEASLHPEWDDWLAAAPGGHHLQTSRCGCVKVGTGWRASRIPAA